jgi:hypothetical protein
MSRTRVIPEHVHNTQPGKRALKLAKRLDAEAAKLAKLQQETASLKAETERQKVAREQQISQAVLEFRLEYEKRMLKLNDSCVALSGVYMDVLKAKKMVGQYGAECLHVAWQRFTADKTVLALA